MGAGLLREVAKASAAGGACDCRASSEVEEIFVAERMSYSAFIVASPYADHYGKTPHHLIDFASR